MRNEPVACRAIVLIALGKNLAILDDNNPVMRCRARKSSSE
jgi:hypothetical protein